MATTKRLTPTGVNMSIPEFTDKPDQRVNSTALGQLADAINTGAQKIGVNSITFIALAGNASKTYTVQNDFIMFILGTNGSAISFIDSVRVDIGNELRSNNLASSTGNTYMSYSYSNGQLTITNTANSYNRLIMICSKDMTSN